MNDDLIIINSSYGCRYNIRVDHYTTGWWLYAYRPASDMDGWIAIGEHVITNYAPEHAPRLH